MAGRTIAVVNITIANDETWKDSFRFGDVSDTSWSFTGMDFFIDVKADAGDTAPIIQLSTTDNEIRVIDDVERVISIVKPIRAPERALLPAGTYVYDLIMQAQGDPDDRTRLMKGTLTVEEGATKSEADVD